MKNLSILLLISVVIFSSCSTTRPRLSYSGSQYNSVSDDIIIYNSSQEAIMKLASNLNKRDKILLVKVVNNDINDFEGTKITNQSVFCFL